MISFTPLLLAVKCITHPEYPDPPLDSADRRLTDLGKVYDGRRSF